MAIITSGVGQNSYIDIDDANLLFLTVAASFMNMDDVSQFTDADGAYLIEAASDIDELWSFAGEPADMAQDMAWPRRYVRKPGFRMPNDSQWGCDYDYDQSLRFKIDFLTPGFTAVPFLDATVVPQKVKEAQLLIALLRKQGGNLVGDDQGNNNGIQPDQGVKIVYTNAIRDSRDIHKRLAGLGTFIGDGILRVSNA